jgi:hypothetical protein
MSDERTAAGEDTTRAAGDADPLTTGAAAGMDGGGIGAVFGLDTVLGRGDPTGEGEDVSANAGEDAGTLADEPVDASPLAELGGRDEPR